MNKYIYGVIASIIVAIVGLALLIQQTMVTKNIGVNVSEIPRIGILYAFIFSVGAIAAIAIANLNTNAGGAGKKKQ